MTDWVAIGKITSPHGVRGWVKVMPLTDDPGRFEDLQEVSIAGTGKAADDVYRIEDVKYQHDRVLLKFTGVGSREDAEKLKNRTIQVPESEVGQIEEEDTYYYYQMEGLTVEDMDGEVLGTLTSVFSTGSNDIYVVKGEGKTEYYVPALKVCVQKVDLEAGVMTVDREWIT